MANTQKTIETTTTTSTSTVADNTATHINNFKSNVAKAVLADVAGQSFRSQALEAVSLIPMATLTDDVLTPSDITVFAQEVLCKALGIDWKEVADKDNLLATRSVYKEVLWVLTYLNATGAACDKSGNAGITLTSGKIGAGRIWLKTNRIPAEHREEDAPEIDKFSFMKVLSFAKAHFAKIKPGQTGSDAFRVFTQALAFKDNIILMKGENPEDYPDDKILPGDAELLIKALYEMASWMNEAMDDKENGANRAVKIKAAV